MKRVYWKKWKRRSKWPLGKPPKQIIFFLYSTLCIDFVCSDVIVLTLRTTRMQRIALKCWQMSTLTESGLLRSQRRHQQRARFFVFQKYLQRWIDHTILVFQLVHAKKIARQKDQLKRQFQVLFHWLEWATQHHPLRCRYEIAKKRYSSRYLQHWITYTTNNWSKRLRQRKGIRRYVGKYLALWKDMASTRRRQLQRLQNHTSHGFMLPIMRTPAFASLPGSVQAYLAGSNQHAKYHYCIDMWRKRSCFVKLRQRLGLLQSKRKSISSRSWRLYLLRYLMLWRYRIKYVIAYQGRCLTYANIHYCKRLRKKYLLFWLHRIQHTKQCQALSRYPRLKRFISSWQQWLYQKRYQQQICSKRGQLRFEVNALTASLRLWHRWSREEKTLRVRYHVFQQLYPALSHDQLNVRKIFLIWKHDYLIYARRCKEWQCRQAEKLRRRRLNMALTRWLDGFELHRIHQCQLRRACCHWYQFTDKMKTWRRHVITLHRIHEELVTWQSSGHPQSLVDFVYKQLYEYHHHHRHVHELFKACYLRRLFIDWKFYSRNSRIQRVTHRELHHRNSQQCAQVVQRRQHVEQILFPLALQQRMWKVWLKYVITRKLISRQISWKYFGRMYFMRWLKSYNYLVMARSIYQVLPQFNPTDKDVSLLSAITSSSIAQHKIAGDLSYLSIQQQSRHRVHGKESSREGKQASQDRSFVKDIVDWKIPASKRSVGTLPRREDEQPKQRNLLISAVVKKQGDEGDLDNAEDDDESSIMSEDSMTCSQSQYSDLTVEDNSQLPPSQHVMSNHIFVPVNTSISQHESNTSITSQAMRKAVDSSVNASVLNSTKGTLQSRKTTSFASMGSTSRISTGKSLQIHAKIVSKVSIDKENNHNSKLSVPRQSVSTKVPTHRIRLDEEELQNRSYLHHYQVQKEHKAETSSLCTGSSRSIL